MTTDTLSSQDYSTTISTFVCGLFVALIVYRWFNSSNWTWFTWVPTSMKALVEAETRLLKDVKSHIVGRFLPIRMSRDQIWTLTVEKHEDEALLSSTLAKDNYPLVLMHGFAGGSGQWLRNFDAFAETRTVYAFDLLGFGRSSRPQFPSDATDAERDWVQSIEDWRIATGIERMILVAHSLASAYALQHPTRVRHLILVDPWGFPQKRSLTEQELKAVPPSWVVTIMTGLNAWFNPLALIRAVGPFGPFLVRLIRRDFGRIYRDAAGIRNDAIYDYIYHCNAQHPSGEVAFKTMSIPIGWARRPMIVRLPGLHKSVPISFIYGGKSWIDAAPGYEIKQRLRFDCYVAVHMIKNAGHYVYADPFDEFNRVVVDVCRIVDQNLDCVPQTTS